MRIGRNDICYCGSGKKYKKCCMNRNVVLSQRSIPIQMLEEIKQYRHDNHIKTDTFTEEDVLVACTGYLDAHFEDRPVKCVNCRDYLNRECCGNGYQNRDEVMDCLMVKARYTRMIVEQRGENISIIETNIPELTN